MPTRAVNATALDVEGDRIRAAYARRTLGAADDRYSWFNDAHMLAVQERERHVLDLLRRHGFAALASLRVLEVGCGVGGWVRDLVRWGVQPQHITAVDLLEDRIAEAARLCPPGITFKVGNAADLEFAAASFDLVLQSMLFTSVLDGRVRRAAAESMRRVLRPGGAIIWYDYHVNNPNNPDVRGVSRAEIHELFPQCRIDLRRVTLAAPIARRIAPRSRVAYAALHAVPWLRTHYVGLIRPMEERTA